MKRVLNVISTLEQGGTESVVLNYFNNIDKSEVMFDFLVIWGDKKGYYEDFLRGQGCNIFKMTSPPNKYFAHGRELKKFFKQEKYDVVHIHAMSSLRYRVAKAAKQCGVKNVIYHSHSSSNEKHLFIHRLLKQKLNKWCDYKFACSTAAGQYMYSGEFKVINNAIDVKKFSFNNENRSELRRKYGLENKFVIGNVGRLSELKNQSFLLKASKILKKINNEFVIFCIGEGNERDYLQKYAADNDLQDNLILAGNVGTEVYKYYSMFDLLAFPSHYEGLSMVLMEAQANGLPIVASDTISPEHKLCENFEFLSIAENETNYSEWAETINLLRDKRQQNVEAVSKAGFDIRIEAKKLQEFYLSL